MPMAIKICFLCLFSHLHARLATTFILGSAIGSRVSISSSFAGKSSPGTLSFLGVFFSSSLKVDSSVSFVGVASKVDSFFGSSFLYFYDAFGISVFTGLFSFFLSS